MAKIKVNSFSDSRISARVPAALAEQVRMRSEEMGLTVSDYLRFLAAREGGLSIEVEKLKYVVGQVPVEVEKLKNQIAQMQEQLSGINKMAFRAFLYGWFCALSLKESQIKQVELKVEKELSEYEKSLSKRGGV